jgi:DNA-binding Lrp family transcriptional regulator
MRIANRNDWSPIPSRALSDKRLSASHFRLLGAIAVLSRPSAEGLECTTAQTRLGETAGIAATKVPAAIRKLADLGYLACFHIKTDRRALAYRILYANAGTAAGLITYEEGSVSLPPTASLPKPVKTSIPTQIVSDPKSSSPDLESNAYQDAFTATTLDFDTQTDQIPDRGGGPLPANWRLTMDRRLCAEELRERLGLPCVDLDIEADKFVAHNRALSGPAANHRDWNQAWLDWVIAVVPTKSVTQSSPAGNTLPQGQQCKGRLIDRMTVYAEATIGAPGNADLEAF